MSLLNTVLGDTVGNVWSAATGTVDPWTKANIAEDEANNNIRASGGKLSASDAMTQAQNDVTGVLVQANADPSQAGAGLLDFNKTLTEYIFLGVVGVIGVVLLIHYLDK